MRIKDCIVLLQPMLLRALLCTTMRLAIAVFAILQIVSCSKIERGENLRLSKDVYGFHLGETKEELFSRCKGSIRIERAPEPPLGYRGELYYFSNVLDGSSGVEVVRCAFFQKRLLEVIVYFQDTSYMNLEYLKQKFESSYGSTFKAEDPSREMAQKTYRMNLPDMNLTLRRITKKECTELYAQFLHAELHRRLLKKGLETKRFRKLG